MAHPSTSGQHHPLDMTVKSSPALRPYFGRSIGFVAGGMGDQIYHLTQLRALASASLNGQIDIACIHPGPLAALLAHTPWVNRIIDARPFRRYLPGIRGGKDVAALRASAYEAGFVLHRSTSFKLVARAAHIKMCAGLCDGMIDRALLHHPIHLEDGGQRRALWGHRPFIGAIDSYVMQMGLRLDTDTPTIIPGKDETALVATMLADLPRPIHIINMFALDPARRWPIDSAIALIATLAKKTGGSFLLNAGPDASDYHDAAMQKWRDIARRTNGIKESQLADCLKLQPSMAKDVALYHQADIYIGVDSFTANLALNCNLPAVILFAHDRDVLRYRDAVWPIVAPEAGIIGTIAHDNILTGVDKISQKQVQERKARALDYAPE